ncbi:MAG TPA: hypothetical protein ENF26_06250 [Methanomicrobia archaeon]|nr:hypothetical protein [Methanomicrobia archaeon]HEX59729.1 hypothetical protein [Methanomicrobia archaeon]
MLEKIERWVSRLPKSELEMPILELDGVLYTPLDILEEVRAGTELGERLQERWEELRGGIRTLHNDETMYELARVRLLKRLQERPVRIMTLTAGMPTEITAEQLMRDIETGGDLGESLVKAEVKVIQRLIRA